MKTHFEVVKNVSFKIRGGEIFAVAGDPDRTAELADAIAGLMKSSKGQVILNGKDITKMTIRERTDSGMAYIPEDRQKYGVVMDISSSG